MSVVTQGEIGVYRFGIGGNIHGKMEEKNSEKKIIGSRCGVSVLGIDRVENADCLAYGEIALARRL